MAGKTTESWHFLNAFFFSSFFPTEDNLFLFSLWCAIFLTLL